MKPYDELPPLAPASIGFLVDSRPPTVGMLYIVPGVKDFGITVTRFPGRWHRFWQGCLLGFKYERQ